MKNTEAKLQGLIEQTRRVRRVHRDGPPMPPGFAGRVLGARNSRTDGGMEVLWLRTALAGAVAAVVMAAGARVMVTYVDESPGTLWLEMEEAR